MADSECNSDCGDDITDVEDLVKDGWCPYNNTAEAGVKLISDIQRLLADGDNWCRNAMCIDKDGKQLEDVHDDNACAWCLSGAIGKLTGIEGDRLEWAVEWYNWEKPSEFFNCLDKAIYEYTDGQYGLWTDGVRTWPDPLYAGAMSDSSSNHTLESFNDRALCFDDINNVLLITEKMLKGTWGGMHAES